MTESFFSYNISRPYPFRWFTPLLLVGGIVLAVLFSLINFATNGFELKPKFTTDPNTTISQEHWYTNAPWSWSGKLRPTCESHDLSVGTEFFTTNFGLLYTVAGVWRNNDSDSQTLPSVSYLNNTLTDCVIERIEVHLARADQSSPSQSQWWSWDDSSATAHIHCTALGNDGPTNVTFFTNYKEGPTVLNYLVSMNTTKSSSLWWGTRLASLYWNGMLVTMANAEVPPSVTGDTVAKWDKGQMVFSPSQNTDITKTNFFNLNYYFLASTAQIFNTPTALVSESYNNESISDYSRVIAEGDGFAKALYSLILTDLGVDRADNLLLHSDKLQHALAAPDDENRSSPGGMLNDPNRINAGYYTNISAPRANPSDPSRTVFANQSYESFKDRLGPLGTFSATMYFQYVCSVPEKKDTASLIVSILIADLVFLQVAWKAYTVFSTWLVEQNDPKYANYCIGCLNNVNHQEIESKLSQAISEQGSDIGEGLPLVDVEQGPRL